MLFHRRLYWTELRLLTDSRAWGGRSSASLRFRDPKYQFPVGFQNKITWHRLLTPKNSFDILKIYIFTLWNSVVAILNRITSDSFLGCKKKNNNNRIFLHEATSGMVWLTSSNLTQLKNNKVFTTGSDWWECLETFMSSHLNICNVLSPLENYCEAPLVLDAFKYQRDTERWHRQHSLIRKVR